LVYNSVTSLWENKFLDYNTLLNKPTSANYSFAGLSDTAKPSVPNSYVRWNSSGTQLVYSTTIPSSDITGLATVATTGNYNDLTNKPTSGSYSFAGLSDTAKPALPNGYVRWNSSGTQLIYSTTIPAANITGLATVATTGNYNDLINKPTLTGGTVTNVSVVTANGVSGLVANPTTTPAITITLGDITPTSVTATGTVTGSNLSGINTGDQTITLTGDVTGSGTGTFPAILATVNLTTGTFGDNITVPQITVDSKGRITNVVNVPIAGTGVGTVTSVSATGANGVSAFVMNATTTPEITIGLGDITPSSVAATGTVTGSNLSGVNTGDQTITLTGDITGSGTGTFPTTLATVNADVGTFGDSHFVPTITLNEKGLVTALKTQHVDTTVRDVVPDTEVITIDARHQYIVTSMLEVDGYIVNNGVIAII